ncbi:MAG: aconitase family protein, partial [Gemmatimonadota bacterium]
MGATVVEKIARAHMADGPDRPLRPGDTVSLRPRHILTHDNTSAVMAKFQALGASTVSDPAQPVVVLDHDIQNLSPENVAKYRRIRDFCRRHDLTFHPEGTGIGHQIMVERGFALPGSLVVASDSHANTYGAVGALGTPVVRTDAAAIWATGEFWWQIPRTVQVWLDGSLPDGVSGKDLILSLCHLYNDGEVLNAALEFTG